MRIRDNHHRFCWLRYTDSMYSGIYVPPTLTVDSVIFRLLDGQLEVLLIQRSQDPFRGMWALPGGYCAAGETTEQATSRVLLAKGGIASNSLPLIEQLYTFDVVDRDPRGPSVSVTYMGLGIDLEPASSASTQNPTFFRITDLPELAYDHESIIRYAHGRLQSKLSYTNAVFALMPRKFTLSQLQTAYEAVFCRPMDKRNFRKKFLSLNLVIQTEEMLQDGAHRPARLYQFRHTTLQSLARNFE
jgi:8-oxo-dGTP diphosphatase